MKKIPFKHILILIGRELALRWHCDVSWKCSSQDAGPDVQCLAYNLSVDLTGNFSPLSTLSSALK